MKNIFSLIIIACYMVPLIAQVPGTWSLVHDMNEVRNGHTATYMTNGNVLVTGGFNGSENLKSAEIYDPIADSWANAGGEMDSIRYQHTATALDNGKVIIAGGWDGGDLNYIGTQIYDPDLETFFDGPDMHTGRSGHTATKLQNGKVLIVGGYSNENGNTNFVDLYDPETNTIAEVDTLHYGRSYHCTVLLDDGRVLVAGGYNPDYGFQMNSVEIYDPSLNTWTDGANMNITRDFFGMANIPNYDGSGGNKVYAAGGRFFNGSYYEGLSNTEIYDVSTGIWTIDQSIPEGQSYLQLFFFMVGQIEVGYIPHLLIPGSTYESGISELTFSHSYVYNAASGWDAMPMFGDGRYFYAADKLKYDLEPMYNLNPIMVCGGLDKTVEIFQPALWGDIFNEYTQTFSISPNPANTEINIELNNTEIVKTYLIYNSMGAKVVAQDLVAQNQFSLPVVDLLEGVYMVQLQFENESTATAFFVKQ